MSPETPWLDGLTFGEVLARTADRCPERDALVFSETGHRRSYREFREEVCHIARALVALGVAPGDNVGVWAGNIPHWVVLQFATAHVGAVLVNINPSYRSRELEYALGQSDIVALFLSDSFKDADFFSILSDICPQVKEQAAPGLKSDRFPRLRAVVGLRGCPQPGMMSWKAFSELAESVPDAELRRREARVRSDDVVNIQYTSGTTGFPKGAMLTHRNLLLNAYHVGCRQAFSERDRLCIPVPFYHCFGCVMGTLLCASFGAAMVVPAESFDALAALQAIQAERCTALYGVPTMFIAELNHPRFAEFDLSSLRTGIMAGSPCPIEIMRAVTERMGARGMTIAYGLTEASPVITQTEVTDAPERRVATVGKPLPGLEVKVVAPGDERPLGPEQPGELMVRGHGVMKGYYQKPAETAEAITPDGWLHTGDVAVQTTDGYYRITGRIKDLIIRGGENIYPREVEEFLHTHPAILDVQVVGLPDSKYFEEVSAWVRLKPDARLSEPELRAFCEGQIARFKVPRYIVFVDEYPTTVTGKVQKFRLRELGIERFHLGAAARMSTA